MADAYLCRASGGVKIELLWENASPTSAFPAQTITLTDDRYDYLLLLGKSSAPSAEMFVTTVSSTGYSWIGQGATGGTGVALYARSVFVNGKTLQFSTGNSTGGNKDIFAVPIKIAGVYGGTKL